MGMTMAEKILAHGAGLKEVSPGQLVKVKTDVVLGNDVTAPVAIREFEKLGVKDVFDKERIMLVPDHFVPAKDIKSATLSKVMRDFAHEKGIKHYFEIGEMGIEHVILPEKGLVLPGDIVIGADSHTCTYGALGAFATGVGSTDMAAAMATGETWFKVPESIKFHYHGKLNPYVGGKDLILHTIGKIGVAGARYQAMEFMGETISQLSMDHRFTISNMAIDAGAKVGLIEPDETTLRYVRERAKRPYQIFRSDKDVRYIAEYDFDVSKIEPTVAFPHLPENTHPISEVGEIAIDQVVIGSCTNGRIEDLRAAAAVFKGNKVNSNVRVVLFPGSQDVYLQAVREGLVEIFIKSGVAVSTPTCGSCLGGHMGVLAKGEKAVSTTNRNFVGRMGHPESEVYLANPYVAAASAIKGRIASPEEVVKPEEVA